MISTWTLYIYSGRQWERFDSLTLSEYPTRRAAEQYAKQYAYDLQITNEWEYRPRVAVVPDLEES